ncbi:MAG: DUF4435 domain-containing protein [Lachnospiraceae bacterium]|nr:DUF4435 domain-containing protein [Lachnospiraceae bacterium]
MDEGLDDLKYSSEALAARFLLFQGLNEINVIVEDTNKEYIYETIFKRLLGEQFKISAIFAVGGKLKVKERYHEFGEITEGIRNFYIVDGDFDRYIYSDEMIDASCFIYLKTYNIENYFLDEDACVQFAKGRLKQMDKEVRAKINFNYWKNRIVQEASKLFLCYCFIKKYHPTIETVSRSSYLFIDIKTGFEQQNGAYQEYWQSVIELDTDAQNKIDKIDAIYQNVNGPDYFNLICGKFLLDSLYCYLRNIFGSKFNHNDFKWHLVNNFDISKLNYIKDAILQVRDSFD